MKIAALIFGALAGFIASLVIALGGMDLANLSWLDPRQMAMARFALIFIANLSLLGAGVAIAIPRAGALLLLLSALAWTGAALLLRHGVDFALALPAGLAGLAAALAFGSAYLRSRSAILAANRALEQPLEFPQPIAAMDRDEPQFEPADATTISSGSANVTNPLAGLDERPIIPGRLSGAQRDALPKRRAAAPAQIAAFREPFRKAPNGGNLRGPAPNRGGRFVALANFALYALLAVGAAFALLNLYQSSQLPAIPKPVERATETPAPKTAAPVVTAPAAKPAIAARQDPAATSTPAAPQAPAAPSDEARLTSPPGLPLATDPNANPSEGGLATPAIRTIGEATPPLSPNSVTIPPVTPATTPPPTPETPADATEATLIDSALAPPVPMQMSSAMALARRAPQPANPNLNDI